MPFVPPIRITIRAPLGERRRNQSMFPPVLITARAPFLDYFQYSTM
jgi:hypothetical protein